MLHRVSVCVDDALYRRAVAHLSPDLNWSEGFRSWLREQLTLAGGCQHPRTVCSTCGSAVDGDHPASTLPAFPAEAPSDPASGDVTPV